MGMVMGQIVEHTRATSEHAASSNDHLEEIKIYLISLPDKIAEKIPKQETPVSVGGKVIPLLKAIKELVQWILPLALLASVVTGKLTMPEALPIIRQALGIH